MRLLFKNANFCMQGNPLGFLQRLGNRGFSFRSYRISPDFFKAHYSSFRIIAVQ